MESAKNIFIAGSDSEIGFATARTLVALGYTVMAAMRSPGFMNQIYAGDLLEYAADHPGELHILELDLTSGSSVGFAADEAFKIADSKIDVLINAEDIGSTGYSETFTVEQLKNLFDINVFGFQRLCRAFLPKMRARKEGLIISISSIFGRFMLPYSGAYSSAKHALDGLVESYHQELKPTEVEVTMVETGGFDASIVENMLTMPDDLERVSSYGDLRNMPRDAWNNVMNAYNFNDEGPAEVAKGIVELINMPAGKRPARLVISDMPGSDILVKLNKKKDQLQKKLLSIMEAEPA